jgi:hypothetical protein
MMAGPEFGNREAVELERASRYVLWKLRNETDFGFRIKIINSGQVCAFDLDGRVLDSLSYLDPVEFSGFLDGFVDHLTRLALKRYGRSS